MEEELVESISLVLNDRELELVLELLVMMSFSPFFICVEDARRTEVRCGVTLEANIFCLQIDVRE